jgi:hypothetical protein
MNGLAASLDEEQIKNLGALREPAAPARNVRKGDDRRVGAAMTAVTALMATAPIRVCPRWRRSA